MSTETDMKQEQTFEHAGAWRIAGTIVGTAMVLGVPAMASVLNLSAITDLLNDFIGILPTFLDLMVAYAPLAVGGAIIAAIVAFPKKILDMFNSFF